MPVRVTTPHRFRHAGRSLALERARRSPPAGRGRRPNPDGVAVLFYDAVDAASPRSSALFAVATAISIGMLCEHRMPASWRSISRASAFASGPLGGAADHEHPVPPEVADAVASAKLRADGVRDHSVVPAVGADQGDAHRPSPSGPEQAVEQPHALGAVERPPATLLHLARRGDQHEQQDRQQHPAPHRGRLGQLASAVVLLLDRGGVAEHDPRVEPGHSARVEQDGADPVGGVPELAARAARGTG